MKINFFLLCLLFYSSCSLYDEHKTVDFPNFNESLFVDQYLFKSYSDSLISFEFNGGYRSEVNFSNKLNLFEMSVYKKDYDKALIISIDYNRHLEPVVKFLHGDSLRGTWNFNIEGHQLSNKFNDLIIVASNSFDILTSNIDIENYFLENFEILPREIVGCTGLGGGKSVATLRSKTCDQVTWPKCSDWDLGTDCFCLVGNYLCSCTTWYECVE